MDCYRQLIVISGAHKEERANHASERMPRAGPLVANEQELGLFTSEWY